MSGNSAAREELERLSEQFGTKFLLAILNSRFAKEWLAGRRRHKIQLYPEDWKGLPVALVPREKQQRLIRLVDGILEEFARVGYPLPAQSAKRVAELEHEIDEAVRKLYGF